MTVEGTQVLFIQDTRLIVSYGNYLEGLKKKKKKKRRFAMITF